MSDKEHRQINSHTYYDRVLKNGARAKDASRAEYQFGITGKEAAAANYKIIYHTGDFRIFHGRTHEYYPGQKDFEESNLSRKYTHEEVLGFQRNSTGVRRVNAK
jgi:hypothetical protein